MITVITVCNMPHNTLSHLYRTCVTNLLKYYSIWYFPVVKYSFQFDNEKIIYEMSSFPANFLSLFPERISVMVSTWWCLFLLFSCHFFHSSVPTLPYSHRQGSRRRQKGSDYTSTSDEEYDSNQSTPKYKRSQPSSASHSPRSQSRPRPHPVVALHPKSRGTDSEDERRENEPLHSWSNHSAEIAR